MREAYSHPALTRSLRTVLAYLRHAALGQEDLMRVNRWFSLAKPRFTTGYLPRSLREPLTVSALLC